ncbi:excinuclease ABC subunit UvrA [Candidatus Phytoplasma meliae]|uniref:UvrABC system protein A n=1 Tax=Candidatus Phytoplasma meliae TaxID=1848402 RepID=A0ABS5CY82_9MOLU|nr:excinuclease ABC subunit UvrA [Candidatus Phytoplasma meliae]MBP5835936.1 excinuclease ABC subunit UvrA [Candidatus Phytoplasma meliae]
MKKTKEYHQFIKIRGARENNLKNINLDIPKNKLVVITGLSGSGKSSLAFDTLYQEGKRRYVESLSAYARQFLGNFEKPDVDSIEGLSPSISIDQKTTSHNPRSTVGTITEIYDYLRLIYANISIPYHPLKKIALEKQTIEQMITKIEETCNQTMVIILAPIIERQKGSHRKTLDKLLQDGFLRVRINEEISLINEAKPLIKNQYHSIEVVVDRILINADNQTRLYEALEQALKLTQGKVFVMPYHKENHKGNNDNKGGKENHILKLNSHYHLEGMDYDVPLKEARIFSFNTPLGACSNCKGIGVKGRINYEKIIDINKSLNDGAILINQEMKQKDKIKQICKHYQIDMNIPLKYLETSKLEILLYGSLEQQEYFYTNQKDLTKQAQKSSQTNFFEGIFNHALLQFVNSLDHQNQTYHQISYYNYLDNLMMEKKCPICQGQKLNQGALLFKINNLNIYELTTLSIDELITFLKELTLTPEETKIINLAFLEVIQRLTFLQEIGLGYLTLARSGNTLSGGEAQRIRLATQIGSKLSGVLYVLDEPSIGLHQKDNDLLINSLKKMCHLGNSLIVVEHDHDTMLAADYLIDIGPKAGLLGGEVQAAGTPQEVMRNPNSLTGKYLAGTLTINIPQQRRPFNERYLLVTNACKNNLKNIDVAFPMENLTVVTGVSGSGKSTLVNDVLLKGLQLGIQNQHHFHNSVLQEKEEKQTIEPNKVNDFNHITKIVEISQSPIGKTPRSNPVTYTGVFDEIRDLYTQIPEAQIKGYQKGRFSFNVKGGRCEACSGDGVKKISMNFLPDVYVKCESCQGTRYQKETLKIKYKGKSIADILNMNIDEGVTFFKNHPKIKHPLEILQKVGLGYIKLGQSSPTLSGGESQRVKLASELNKSIVKGALYILDEPTTGLHSEDVKQLIDVLQHMVDQNATIIVIEHNLDIIKNADYIIDLGPEGGAKGGYLVATGTPEEISKHKSSYTGKYLKKILS